MDDIIVLSLNMLGKSINPLINEWNFDKVPYVIYYRINVRTKSMLSVEPSKESWFIQIMFFDHRIYWPLHLTYVEKK